MNPRVGVITQGSPLAMGLAELVASVERARQRRMQTDAQIEADRAEREQREQERALARQQHLEDVASDRQWQRQEFDRRQSIADQRQAVAERRQKLVDMASGLLAPPNAVGTTPEDADLRAAYGVHLQRQSEADQARRDKELGALLHLMGGAGSAGGAQASPKGPLRFATPKGTVLVDPTTLRRVGMVDLDGNVTLDGDDQAAAAHDAPVDPQGGNYLGGAAQVSQGVGAVQVAGRVLPVLASPARALADATRAALAAQGGGRMAAAGAAAKDALGVAGRNALRVPGAPRELTALAAEAAKKGATTTATKAAPTAAAAGAKALPLLGGVARAAGRANLPLSGALGLADLVRYYGGDDGQTATGTPEMVAPTAYRLAQAVGATHRDDPEEGALLRSWLNGEQLEHPTTPTQLGGQVLLQVRKSGRSLSRAELNEIIGTFTAADGLPPAQRRAAYQAVMAALQEPR